MYFLKKKIQIGAAHKLPNYPGKCKNLHGHNWNITVYCTCRDDQLDDHDMVIDFTEIKKIVNQLDHAFLNDFIENPTAENIAKWLCDKIPTCFMVEVEEAENSQAFYVKDEQIFLIAKQLNIV